MHRCALGTVSCLAGTKYPPPPTPTHRKVNFNLSGKQASTGVGLLKTAAVGAEGGRVHGLCGECASVRGYSTVGSGGACRDCWSRRSEVRQGRRQRVGRRYCVHVYAVNAYAPASDPGPPTYSSVRRTCGGNTILGKQQPSHSLLGRYTFREEGSGKPLTSGGESGAAAGSAGGWRLPRKGELTHHHRDGAETGEDKPGLMTQNIKNIKIYIGL